jgi:hypothetical protein
VALGRAILAEGKPNISAFRGQIPWEREGRVSLKSSVLVGVEGRGEAFFCGAFVKVQDLGGALEQVAW